MTAQLFLTYLAFVVLAVIGVTAAYLPRRTTLAIVTGLAIWLVYVGLFSSLGYMRDPSLRPPGILWVVGPVVLFVVFVVVRSNIGARVAAAIPLWLILGFRKFPHRRRAFGPSPVGGRPRSEAAHLRGR
jgi:hypothetical protein